MAEVLEPGTIRSNWELSLTTMLTAPAGGSAMQRIELSNKQKNEYFAQLVCHARTHNDRVMFLEGQKKGAQDHPVLRRIMRAIDIFKARINNFLKEVSDQDAKQKRLFDLMDIVTKALYLLRLEVTHPGIAYEVFEGLNARGLELSQSDLIRNKLYSKSKSNSSADEITDMWDRLEEAFASQSLLSKLSEVFYFHLRSRGERVKETASYQGVINYIEKKQLTALRYLEDVTQSMEYLASVLEGRRTPKDFTARSIDVIQNTFKNKYVCVPILANAGRIFKGDEESALIKALENFVFRKFVIERTSLTEYSNDMCEAAKKIHEGVIKNSAELRTFFKERSNTQSFVENFKSYSVQNMKYAFYVIESIENFLSKDAGVKLQPHSPSQHVEHILPKKPGSDGWSHLSADIDHKEWINRVGNLLVLEATINQRLSNKGFDEKFNGGATSYIESVMRLPKETKNFLRNGKWTVESIAERQEYIAQTYAARVWTFD